MLLLLLLSGMCMLSILVTLTWIGDSKQHLDNYNSSTSYVSTFGQNVVVLLRSRAFCHFQRLIKPPQGQLPRAFCQAKYLGPKWANCGLSCLILYGQRQSEKIVSVPAHLCLQH